MKKALSILAAASALPLFAQDALFNRDIVVQNGAPGQEYHYVDQQVATTREIHLTRGMGGDDVFLTLPAITQGDDLLIILASPDKQHYLVKSPFGIVGWMRADGTAAAQKQPHIPHENIAALKKLENLPKTLTDESESIPPFVIYYNPDRIAPLTPAQSNEDVWALLEGKFGEDDTVYRLECTRGLSGDPHCGLLTQADIKKRADAEGKGMGLIGTDELIMGETFHFYGFGNIYAAGRLNSHYPYARLLGLSHTLPRYSHTYEQAHVFPVFAPYEYVGLESVADADFALRARETGSDDTIAQVKKGDALTVVLAKPKDCYCPPEAQCEPCGEFTHTLLVKTQDGTLGWVTQNIDSGEHLIRDYVFAGD